MQVTWHKTLKLDRVSPTCMHLYFRTHTSLSHTNTEARTNKKDAVSPAPQHHNKAKPGIWRKLSNRRFNVKKAVRNGYSDLSYDFIPAAMLGTFDVISEIVFINNLGNSEYLAARPYFVAAGATIAVITLINFCTFVGVYTFARNRGCVDDEAFNQLMPGVLLVAIVTMSDPGAMVLLPWIKRDFEGYPTKCAYIACDAVPYAVSVRSL